MAQPTRVLRALAVLILLGIIAVAAHKAAGSRPDVPGVANRGDDVAKQ